jgi:septum site-determining protein MinC
MAEFDTLSQRSPGFFVGRPIILDVAALPRTRSDLLKVVTDLQSRNVRVMGLEGVEAFALGADARGLPPILTGTRPIGPIDMPEAGEATDTATAATAPPPHDKPSKAASLLLDSPVRSGQAVHFPDGDVTVLGSVASGAEIIAGGSIHVYGTLRGRAVAGSNGNPTARIFCRKLEAELLAIDGLYKTSEDMEAALRGRPVQAWLKNDAMVVAALA